MKKSSFSKNELIVLRERLEPSCPISVGACVVLNSGGPNMLVVSIKDMMASLVYVGRGCVHNTDLDVRCLTLIGDVDMHPWGSLYD
tara:strand:+ start:20728 stop:20985 length:258 start_codon:yes stop_codon:yes gene_type:complete